MLVTDILTSDFVQLAYFFLKPFSHMHVSLKAGRARDWHHLKPVAWNMHLEIPKGWGGTSSCAFQYLVIFSCQGCLNWVGSNCGMRSKNKNVMTLVMLAGFHIFGKSCHAYALFFMVVRILLFLLAFMMAGVWLQMVIP